MVRHGIFRSGNTSVNQDHAADLPTIDTTARTEILDPGHIARIVATRSSTRAVLCEGVPTVWTPGARCVSLLWNRSGTCRWLLARVHDSRGRTTLPGTRSELTSIRTGSADDIIAEVWRLASKKNDSYKRRGIFDTRPLMLLGHLGSIRDDTERPALYDVHKELAELIVPSDFEGFGFSEIWLMDCGPKYTLRRDPRTPADFFCVAPAETIGFWERERKRHPYWGLIRDFLT